ncbi:hypothetical protein INR49_008198 [Caranx melampygus]|nr:hypothetical protein INR49_008198 [Caranx melampygus]
MSPEESDESQLCCGCLVSVTSRSHTDHLQCFGPEGGSTSSSSDQRDKMASLLFIFTLTLHFEGSVTERNNSTTLRLPSNQLPANGHDQTSSPVSLLGTLLILLLLYFVWTFSFSSQDDRKEPPGPRPLPLLGNLLQLDHKTPYKTLLKFAKKYGSVFTIYMGLKKVVVLAGYRTVKEALVNYAEEFGDRDETRIMHESNQGHGVIWSNGDSWREMRRFALTNLKDFGMGKKACEDKIIEECKYLTEVFRKSKGKTVETAQPINCAVSNIICSIIYGSRYEYDDPEFTALVKRVSRRLELVFSPSMQMYNLFPRVFRWIADRKEFHNIDSLIKKHNLELFRRLDETLNPQMCRGFVDAFLVQKKKLEESGVANSHFHNENLLKSVTNLFSAGTETTATTLKMGLLLMAKNPNIQGKGLQASADFTQQQQKTMFMRTKRSSDLPAQVQEELSSVVGSRQVQVEDRKNLPFTNAVIHETQRVTKIAPQGIPHRTSKDVTFQGHFIRKGTTVYPLISSVLLDETEWERPHSFHPAHFLDKDGKFVKRDAFIPFSAGRRVCPGESLARMELFIFFTTLLQHFHFSLPPGFSEDEMDQTSSSLPLLGTLLILLLLYFVSIFSFSSRDDRREPPGPRPLPLLGNLLQLDLKRPFNTLLKFSKTYGSVFTIYMGPKKVVVLAGYRTVKEALVNYAEEFGERDATLILQEVSQGHGVLWSNGDSWREMRRFALTNLRDYGMGKKACEDKISEETHYLTEVFRKFKGEAFDMTQPVTCAVSNIICSLVYGSRFDYDDPEFTSMVDRTNKYGQLIGSRQYSWITNRQKFYKLYEANRKMNLELLRRLTETLNPDMCRGFIDAFLVRKQHLENSDITNNHFHNENLLMTVLHLFAAGTETTSTTIRWGLLLMAKYPKIQAQVQQEISSVIGSRQVQVEDRKNLPFTDAVIHETQRVANIIPFSLPHKTSQDVTFQGYFIKKGTTVYPLLTSVLYDENEWERPHSFHPAHFLDKDGKFMKREAFIPFSAGRRVCLGESLARMELFIFFTTLLQHFRFTPAPGVSEDDLDLTPCVGITLSPSPHKLCAIPCM